MLGMVNKNLVTRKYYDLNQRQIWYAKDKDNLQMQSVCHEDQYLIILLIVEIREISLSNSEQATGGFLLKKVLGAYKNFANFTGRVSF